MVTPPDMEMFICKYLREKVDAEVDNKEPSDTKGPLMRPLIIVRDDSGTKGELVTFDRSLGVSVLAGTREDDKPANDIARHVFALLTDQKICTAECSPIVSVEDDGCNGPYAVVEDHDYARRYMTIEYMVVGEMGD